MTPKRIKEREDALQRLSNNRFKCRNHGKVYATRKAFVQHWNAHDAGRTFPCRLSAEICGCGASYPYAQSRNAHELAKRNLHGSSGVPTVMGIPMSSPPTSSNAASCSSQPEPIQAEVVTEKKKKL